MALFSMSGDFRYRPEFPIWTHVLLPSCPWARQEATRTPDLLEHYVWLIDEVNRLDRKEAEAKLEWG